MAKELYTFLAKVQSVLSKGKTDYYSPLMLVDHKGNKFKCCRANIDEKVLKTLMSDWSFIRVEYRGERFYFNKTIACNKNIADLMIEQHRKAEWDREQSQKENKEVSL